MRLRRPARDPQDPHARFGAWLARGAVGDPGRDVALHASLCGACAIRMEAFDQLREIDVGRAPMPQLSPARPAMRTAAWSAGRVAAGGAIALVLAIGLGFGALNLLPPGAGVAGGGATPTPNQQVLGNAGGPATTPDGSASQSASSSPSDQSSPTPLPGDDPAGPAPVQPTVVPRPTSRPASPTPGATSRPTPTAAPTVNSAEPTPTSQPTATPVSTPTADPTPEPQTPRPDPTPTSTPAPTPGPTP